MPNPRVLLLAVLLLCFTIGACGGGSDTPPAPGGGTQPPPSGGGGGSGQINEPVVITVTSGVTTAGVDITVPQKSGGEPNAELLGVGDIAQNTGATVRRGQTVRVILFGSGLSDDMTVSLGGPDDIQISNVQRITSETGTPGIGFQVAVSGNAAVGARTVFLRRGENITAFTGGLEVLP